MAKWIKTEFTGVRYREHPTRKHGIMPDRYFSIRYQFDGKRKEEGRGWASEEMTAEKAALTLAALKEAARTGSGESRLSEQREARKAVERKVLAEKKEQERKAVTYKQFYDDHYLFTVQGKKDTTLAREESLHKLWVVPALGSTPIKDIGELDIFKVKRSMEKKNLAPRSVQYAFTCIQMVISHAIKLGYYQGVNPIQALPKNSRPKFDNRKTRFFSHEDAYRLLEELAEKSDQVHDMTLLSLHCGLRFGEIASLTWRDVDQVHGFITLRNTKSGNDRTVTMTNEVSEMFSGRTGDHGELVFPCRTGKPQRILSRTFARVVDELGFNDGVAKNDRKQKLTFHSCRHTCASWLVMAGVPLYTVQKILGHSTIAMTERYAHLAPKEFKAAVNLMEQGIVESRAKRKSDAGKVVNIK